MPLTLEQLVDAGFSEENFPPELPAPGPDNISLQSLGGSHELYRYSTQIDGVAYGMEIQVDRSTLENPAEGVNYMLNQFAYLWRMSREKIMVAGDGSYQHIDF